MGRDKARLRLGEGTMLGQIKETVSKTGRPFRVIQQDLVPGKGPLGGVYTALKTTSHDEVLFLACDMPFVEVEFLNRFFEKNANSRAVFTKCKSRLGFPFLLSRQILSIVAGQLGTKNLSLNQLAKKVRAKVFTPPPGTENQLCNVNTPLELRLARKTWNHRGGG